MTAFGSRLRAALDTRGPLCVGIDPHADLLRQWGLTDDPAGLERFCMTAVEALADTVAVIKPQSAFFERHGARGIAVLEQVVAAARGSGALVLLDVKRGDIGSTVQAYADAYLHPAAPLACDAVTVSPYLGFGSLRPMIDTALAHDAGVFVLALTSNPEGAEVQRARTADGSTVAGRVLARAAVCNRGVRPLGSVGAVVGANLDEIGEDLAINGPLLAPGLGAQGGTTADVRRLFADTLDNVVPTTSRQVLAAGPDVGAVRSAALRACEELATLRR